MSETEVQVVDVPAAQEEVAHDKKERIKRPTRPDDEATKQKTDALQETINKSKARIEKIKQTIDDRRSGRTKGSGEQQTVKNKLAELRTQFQTILKQKQHMREQMDTAIKTRESIRSSLRDLKSSMKFTTVEEIDAHIEKLEDSMQHSSLSLNEEKRILEDIRKLKQSRATVGVYSSKLESLSQDDSTRGELQAGIKSLDEQLSKIKAEEEVLRAQLTEMRSKDQETNGDFPALLQEREELKEVCKQAYEKIRDLRAAHDAVWQEYKAQEKLWRAQTAEDRKSKQEQWVKEKAARDAERAARLAELAPEPFDREVTFCEQLTNYLGKFVASDSGAVEEEKKEVAAPEGLKQFQKAGVDEEDTWLLGKPKGKGKGKKAETKAAAPAPAKLTHTLDVLEAFTALKISAPSSAAQVPSILEEVAAKKEDFLNKRKVANEAKANGTAAAEAAAPAEPAAESSTDAAEANDAESAADAPKEGSKKGKKGGNKGEAPKLEDASSFPALGTTAPAAAAAAPAEEASAPAQADATSNVVAEEVEEGELVVEAPKPVAPAPKAKTPKAAPALKPGETKVSLTTNGNSVSVEIAHGE